MKHVIQRKYSYIPYPFRPENPEKPGNVRRNGCCLCSACMIVDQLTTKEFPVKDAVKLALDVKANHATGTDVMIFGPAVAEKFDLEFKPTDDIYEAIEAVRDGGRVMLRVSNRHACNKGIFTVSGHYMVMVSATKDEVCILDPNWSVKKYKKWADLGYVKMKDRFLYTTPEILHNEGIQGLPRYYIFRRK